MTDTKETHPPITIEAEMQKSYLDYAMSVIVSRALPDVRDGLKPVHRRILYAMKEGGYDSTKPFRKSARIVGDVMGKYHPHGDSAIYDAMVRMAQDFSLLLPLVQGQGNFGSMDNDPPAAMRYTEARLNKAAETMLEDIDKATVDFRPNYDDSDQEPVVLPSRFPNLLVNGSSGIAVGMATNIPPHNLTELLDACCALVDNPELELSELMQYVQGPDFPTGGYILGRGGIMNAFKTGKGSLLLRAKTKYETFGKDRTAIIVNEVPYQTNKSKLVERISEVAREKIIEGISEVRDESDRDGVRVVIELKRDATPEVVLNQLYVHTGMQISFGVNTVALHQGKPQLMDLMTILRAFIAFREEVITRRTIYLLTKAREKAHILVGLATAVANIDEIIKVIRHAPDPATAREQLMSRDWPSADNMPLIRLVEPRLPEDQQTYRLSEIQARAILELRLHRLTGLERDKIGNDLREVTAQIADLLDILSNRSRLLNDLKTELLEIREKFGKPRKTEIVEDYSDVDLEDLIEREDMVVLVSHQGYIKRVPLSTYRAQHRGGKGRSGMTTKAEDFVSTMFVANTHTPMLFFTNFGKVYQLKVYKLPQGTPQAKGKPIVQLLPALQMNERVTAVLPLPENAEELEDISMVFATSMGTIRRNSLSDFVNIKTNGKIAMKLDDGEKLVDVKLCEADDDIFLATHEGMSIRFKVDDVRVFFSRASTGVRAIRLKAGDEVIGMTILKQAEISIEERDAFNREQARRVDPKRKKDPEEMPADRYDELSQSEQFLLSITERGFGKRSSSHEFKTTGRGGVGIAVHDLTKKTGKLVSCLPVSDGDQVMLVTDNGQTLRCAVDKIRIASRRTQGVTLLKVAAGEKVVSVAYVAEEDEEE